MRRGFVVGGGICLVLLVWACDSAGRSVAETRNENAPYRSDRFNLVREAPAFDGLAKTDGPDEQRDALAMPGARDVLPNLIIRNGTASIQVDSLDRAIALVGALARRVGGFVAGSAIQAGQGQQHSASIEIQLPAERFDEAVDGLRPLGKLESVTESSQDVGEEYVDVNARMTNARRLEARLIDLVAHRTGKLGDVLDIEQQLARVREEIERYEGRLRYLRTRAAVSTLTLTVHEPFPVVDHGAPNVVAEAARQAWRNFIALVALVIQSLGVIIPLGAAATAAWWGVKRVRKLKPATT